MYVPRANKRDDNHFFLASFPRSGNTWVRFLLANIYNAFNKKFDEIDFHNIHEIVPEYGAEEEPCFDGFPKVFKTHAHYNPCFKNTILLVRNPFDSLYSRCDLLNNNRGIAISLEETVKHEKYGMKAIIEHTNSFVKACENLIIITYERLQHEPRKEIRKILDFLHFHVPDHFVEGAIRKSSFHVMRQIEREKGRPFGIPNFKHIRFGKIGEGHHRIQQNDDLYQYCIHELKKSPILYLLYS